MIQPLFVFYDWGLLALRVVLGIILIVHGLPKLKNLKATGGGSAAMGFRPGAFWAAVAGAVECAGGLLIIVGFLTQLAALFVFLQFLIIIFKVKRGKGLAGGYEFNLLITAAALLLMTTGGGLWSVEQARGMFLFY
ncbi:oxidoreductase [Candidatus Jorgensenbacteria bacterium CG23_combo_of_CG06-09_8_20_14_all_54_14]|uniref:Oxidoreductase n=1 Tax=Candidatus Jorgensenbacteria bacterium CG23_combo_of_CG06-09_8_20_14_all_54_14 TaxID=1974595 RepID=A0A2G9Z9V1_9BACT|nr:MAG: oxidoreductase [Candidatus Jorgensenbacteria bacterium CG23_combo_of_CG06-09_8_20_14_all_54_14]